MNHKLIRALEILYLDKRRTLIRSNERKDGEIRTQQGQSGFLGITKTAASSVCRATKSSVDLDKAARIPTQGPVGPLLTVLTGTTGYLDIKHLTELMDLIDLTKLTHLIELMNLRNFFFQRSMSGTCCRLKYSTDENLAKLQTLSSTEIFILTTDGPGGSI